MPKRVPVELPVPQIREQTVEVAKASPQERAQQRMAFYVTVDVPQALFIDRAMDIPVVQQADTHAVHGHGCRHAFMRCNTRCPRFRRCR